MSKLYRAYISAQKARIRAGREDEMELICSDGTIRPLSGCISPLRDSADILEEIDGLRGLNMRERTVAAFAARRFEGAAA